MKKSLIVLIFSIFIYIYVFAFDTSTAFDQNIKRSVLDNGMVVLLKENHFSPVAAIQIWVKTGAITEDEYAGSGISHFVEHMLFKGTAKRKVGDIPNAIRDAGGTINAYTSYEETVFHTIVTAKYFDTGLDVLSDAVMNSNFPPEEFNKEKDVILKEINMNKDDPGRLIYRLFWNTAFNVNPYRHPVIGYRDIFAKLTRDDIIKYFQGKYTPDNMVLVITGDFNASTAMEKIKEIFKDFTRNRISNTYIPQEPSQLGKRELIIEKDINVTHMLMGYHGPSIYEKDLFAMDVLSNILGEGRSSRLFKELKEKKQLVYSIYAFSYTPKYPGIFGFNCTLDKKNIDKVQKEIIMEIKKIRDTGVTQEELKKSVNQVLSSSIFGQQTVESQARTIGSNEMINSINFSKEYFKGISNVTEADIKQVIDRYLTPENLTITAIIPKQEKALDSTKNIIIPQEKKEFKLRKTTISNGIRVLTKENHNLPIVNVRVVFEGGVRYENEKNNGINNFLQTIIKKGTASYSGEDLNNIIESMGASLETYSGDNSFGLNLSVMKKDFDKGLKLLSSVITEPTFPQEEIEKERKNILMAIRTREDNVFNAGSRLFKKTMFTEHPYRFSSLGEEESIKLITREDISQFYKSMCTTDNMVIAVYGDINSENAVEKIDNIFGNFGGLKKKTVEIKQEPEQVNIKKVEKEKADINQAIVFLGFRGVNIKNEDRYIFDVISGLYGDQGGRLYTEIREKEGLAYFVGAYSMLGLDPGAYIFYVGTIPEKVELSIKIILKEIEQLKKELISSEELTRIKRNLIGEHAISLQTNESQAFGDALNELYGLGYTESDYYEEKINKITNEDIQRVANQYLNTEHYTLTILLPQKNK